MHIVMCHQCFGVACCVVLLWDNTLKGKKAHVRVVELPSTFGIAEDSRIYKHDHNATVSLVFTARETGIFSHKYRYVISVSWLEEAYPSRVKREGPRFISWPFCTSDCIIGCIELIQSSIWSCELGIIFFIVQKRKLRPKKIKWLNYIHQGLASLFY